MVTAEWLRLGVLEQTELDLNYSWTTYLLCDLWEIN